MKRVVSLLLLLVMLCVAFSVAQAKEVVEVRIASDWSTGGAAQYWNPLIEEFEAKNPDIRIIQEVSNGDEIRQTLAVGLASSDIPDIFNYCGYECILGGITRGGQVLDIDEYFALSGNTKRENFDQDVLDCYTIEGTLYGLPCNTHLFYFACNKALFAQYGLDYPTTYEEMVEVGKVFSDNGIIPFAMGSKGGNPSHFWYSEMFKQLEGGVDELAAFGKSDKFDTEIAYQAARFIADQRDAGLYPADVIANGDWAPAFSLFTSGKAAMIYSFAQMFQNLPDDPAFLDNMVFIPTPKMPGCVIDNENTYYRCPVTGWIVSKAGFDSDRRDAIVRVLDFLNSPYMQNALVQANIVPLRNDFEIDPAMYSPALAKLMDYLSGKTVLPYSHFATISDAASFTVFQNSLDELMAGAISPEEWVDGVQDQLNQKP